MLSTAGCLGSLMQDQTTDICSSLQTGHYTSVFLDNASGSSLTVRSGSHFSAILLGL